VHRFTLHRIRETRPDDYRSLTQIRGGYPDLHDGRFGDAGDADKFEDLVVDLALARVLDHHLLGPGDQRPERRRLRLLGGIPAEREIDPGIGQIGMTGRIGESELFDRGLVGDVVLIASGVMPFFCAAATNCAASMASPTIWRAMVSSQPAARDGDALVDNAR